MSAMSLLTKLEYGLLRITALHKPEGGVSGSKSGWDSIPITVEYLYNGARSGLINKGQQSTARRYRTILTLND
jgi:hypothetical protein